MSPDELQNLFAIRGIRTKVRGDEIQIQECVFCGNPKANLEINVSRNAYHAWCCGAKGRASQFIKEYLGVNVTLTVVRGDFQRKIAKQVESSTLLQPLTSEWAISYLARRGLGSVDSLVYEIFQGLTEKWEGRVVCAMKEYWTQEVAGYVGRAALQGIWPKYYAAWNNDKKVVTGYRSRSDIHIVVEGPFDGIHIHQAGFNAAVLGGVSEVDLESWAARLPETSSALIMLDGDAHLQEERLFWRVLPVHSRTYRGKLPTGFDPGDLSPSVLQKFVSRCLSRGFAESMP